MKRRIVGMVLLAGMIALSGQKLSAAEEKPLAAGVLSLDSSVGVVDQGIANATSSPAYPAPLIATTRYCLPFNMYVMGEPLCGAGR